MPELLNLAETGQQDFLVFDRVDGACKLTGGAIAAALFDLVQDPVKFKKLGSILRIELHGAKVAIFSVRRCRIACIFVVLMPSEQPRKRLLAIIGGGAAGFFAAITAARQDPDAFFALTFRLLQEQLGERLDLPSASITEAVIDEQLAVQGVSPELIEALHRLFHACNHQRYAPGASSHDLDATLLEVRAALQELQRLKPSSLA